MSALETHRMQDVVKNLTTVSDKIRALDDAGFERADIARFLDKRYQHVRNVLVSRSPAKVRMSAVQDASHGQSAARPRLKAKIQIGAGGRIVIPVEMRVAMGISDGDELIARVVDGELRLLSQNSAVKRAQELVRQFVPAGTKLVDELLSDRRTEARREGAE